jgi:hypothetical protein
MARAATVLVMLLGAALYATTVQIRPASACSGPPAYEVLLSAKVILEGRVAEVGPAESSDSVYTTHTMTFDVVRGYRGVQDGEQVSAIARIPIPGVPIMCPQFPQDIEGKYVIIGLFEDEAEAPLRADAWVLLYAADAAPAATDSSYAEAVRLAELVSDANPERPLLTTEPAVVTCGQPVSFAGARFPEGEYAIRERWGSLIAVMQVGPGGEFEASVRGPITGCSSPPGSLWTVAYSVFTVERRADTASLGALVEVAGAELAPDIRTPPREPAITVSPTRAYCGETVKLSGSGFASAQRVTVQFNGETSGVTLAADGAGTFALTRRIPLESCGGTLFEVRALQAEFAEFGFFATLASRYIERIETPPGPPEVGDSPGAARPADGGWMVLLGWLMLLLSAALGGWRLRRRA